MEDRNTLRADVTAAPASLPASARWMLAHPRLFGLGLLGANLFGLVGLAAVLSGAFTPGTVALGAPSALGDLGAQETLNGGSAAPFQAPPAFATADSNDRMIAVTGVDVTGASVLYLIDTVNLQIAVYQATGGAKSTQSIKLVGARRIDYDLQLVGFHDESEYSYSELETQFAKVPVAPQK